MPDEYSEFEGILENLALDAGPITSRWYDWRQRQRPKAQIATAADVLREIEWYVIRIATDAPELATLAAADDGDDEVATIARRLVAMLNPRAG